MQQESSNTIAFQNWSSLFIVKDEIPKKTFRPYILSEDRLQMLKHYRKYVNNYNDLVKKQNKDIVFYNKKVKDFIASNKLQQQAVVAKSNFDNKEQQNTKMKWLAIADYNKLVEATNGTMLLLPKRKYCKIKAAHERTFEVILWLYGNQLRELREHLKDLETNLAVTFPKVKITSTGIAHLTHEGEQRILYSSRTVQNHIYRLRDAGIITDYSFHGTKKPVRFFINSSIFQMHDKSLTSIENQLVTEIITKKVRDKSEDTRTNTKEIIKKVGNVDNHSRKSEVDSFAYGKNKNTYKNSNEDEAFENFKQGSEKNKNSHQNPIGDEVSENSKQYLKKNKNIYKVTKEDKSLKISKQHEGKLGGENFQKNHLSEYLRSQIQHKSKFLQALTDHHYDLFSYSAPQMNKRLETESKHGAMAKEEFRELLLQLFIKIATPIWKDMNVYYGSWHKAYIQIDDEYLRNPNGSIPGKQTLLYLFGLLVYRITRAKRFFKSKKQYCIHYPCIYFDPTRKQPSEGGFAYTLEWLKQYQKYKDLRAKRKQQNAGKAGARRRQKTNEEKVRDKIKLYLKGKITLPMVFNYIENNKGIPNYYAGEVPRLLQLLTNKEFDLYE